MIAESFPKSASGRGGPRPNSGGKREGAGRPRKAPAPERALIEEARERGRKLVPQAVEVWEAALNATTWIRSDKEGWKEVPDIPTRMWAAKEVGNRFGMPPTTKVEHSDPFREFLLEIARRAENEAPSRNGGGHAPAE